MRLKALLLTLIIVLTLSVLPVSYAADISDSSLDFISQLGITDGIDTSDIQRYISRAEFTAMAVRMQNTGILSVADSSFIDVTEETPFAGEVYAAKALSLVNGTSENKFSPDGRVTFGAAVKILTIALGYGEKAIISGGYPTGYMVTASQIGLLKGLSGDHSNNITIETASKLLYNALFTDIYKVVAVEVGAYKYASTPGVNPLTDYFKLKNIKGVVNTAGMASSIPGIDKTENGIGIDDMFMKSDREDLEKYLGLSCSAWYNPEDGALYAAEISKLNKKEVINAEDVVSYSDNSLIVLSGDTTRQISISKGYTFVLNGRAISAAKEDFTFESGTLVIIDNNGDGKIDVVLANKKEYFVITSASEDNLTVYDKNARTHSINFEDKHNHQNIIEVFDFTSGTKRIAEFDELSVNMVLEYYVSDNGKLVRVLAGNHIIKGTATEYDNDSVLIDGVEYKTNEYFKENNKLLSLGNEAEFLIAPDGTLTLVGKVSDSGIKYGYYLDYANAKNSLENKGKMKILTSDGDVEVYEVPGKVILDGVRVGIQDNAFINTFMNGENPRYQIIKYSKSNGVIEMLDTAEDVSASEDLYTKYEIVTEGNNSLKKVLSKTSVYYTGGFAAPYFHFSGAIIFQVPEELRKTESGSKRYDDNMFNVASPSELDRSPSHYVDAFDYTVNFTPRAVVSYDNKTASNSSKRFEKPSTSDESFVVEDVTAAVDKNNMVTVKIYLCSSSGYSDYAVSSDYYNDLENEGLIPKSGDIVRIVLNSDNEIVYVARDVIYGSDGTLKVRYGNDYVSNTVANVFTYVSGKVFTASNLGFSLITDNYPTDSITMGSDFITSYRVYSPHTVIVYNKSTKKARRVSLSDIADAQNVGIENASYLCARINYLRANTLIVYEN